MKKSVIALALAFVSLATTPVFANENYSTDVDTDAVSVQLEEGDYATEDKAVFCRVAMVNGRGRVIRRYNGRRNFRTWRCAGPMNQCRRDLRWSRRPFARCVELR